MVTLTGATVILMRNPTFVIHLSQTIMLERTRHAWMVVQEDH